MLHIELTREVPEALKPRQIEIAHTGAVKTDVVEAKAVN
jgi:molecular chaperone IbpA